MPYSHTWIMDLVFRLNKTCIQVLTGLPTMMQVPDSSVSGLLSKLLLRSYTVLEFEEMLCGILHIRTW